MQATSISDGNFSIWPINGGLVRRQSMKRETFYEANQIWSWNRFQLSHTLFKSAERHLFVIFYAGILKRHLFPKKCISLRT